MQPARTLTAPPPGLASELKSLNRFTGRDQGGPLRIAGGLRVDDQELESQVSVKIKERPAGPAKRSVAAGEIPVRGKTQPAIVAQETEVVAAEGDEVLIAVSVEIPRGDAHDSRGEESRGLLDLRELPGAMVREKPGAAAFVENGEVEVDISIEIHHGELYRGEIEFFQPAVGADVAEAAKAGGIIAIVVEHLYPGGDRSIRPLPLAQANNIEIPVAVNVESVESQGKTSRPLELKSRACFIEPPLAIVDQEPERAGPGSNEVEVSVSIEISKATEIGVERKPAAGAVSLCRRVIENRE